MKTLVLILSTILISNANAFSFNFRIFLRKPIISGGVPSVSGAYTIRTFTAGGNLVVTGSSVSIEYTVIGGGGGGGNGQDGLPASGGSGGGAGEGFTGTMAFAPGTYPVIVGTGGGSVSVGNPSSINGINANGGVKGNTAGQGGSWTTGGVGGSVPIQYGGTGGSGGAGRPTPGQVGDNGGAGSIYGAGGGGAGAGYNFHGVGGSGAQGVVVVKYLTSSVQ